MTEDNVVESALRLRQRARELHATGSPGEIAAAEIADRAADAVLTPRTEQEQAQGHPSGDRP